MERVSGRAFVQLQDFITVPADVTVLVPKDPKMPLSMLFLVTSIINSEQWQYSYGRKLTAGRLKKMQVMMPVDPTGKPNYQLSAELLNSCYGWHEIMETYIGLSKRKNNRTLECFLD